MNVEKLAKEFLKGVKNEKKFLELWKEGFLLQQIEFIESFAFKSRLALEKLRESDKRFEAKYKKLGQIIDLDNQDKSSFLSLWRSDFFHENLEELNKLWLSNSK